MYAKFRVQTLTKKKKIKLRTLSPSKYLKYSYLAHPYANRLIESVVIFLKDVLLVSSNNCSFFQQFFL